MTEHKLPTPAEWSTEGWHAGRPAVDHLEEATHRPRLELAAKLAVGAALVASAHRKRRVGVIDLGAGAGGLLERVRLEAEGIIELELLGYDFHVPAVELAEAQGRPVVYGNAVTLAHLGELIPTSWGDRAVVAVATELLEHLERPHELLEYLHADDRIEAVVASSPAFETPTDYSEGHRWAWNLEGYAELLTGAGFTVDGQTAVGPFQLIYANRGGTP